MSSQRSLAVSVVICTRNWAGYLENCLASVAAQEFDFPFEVVVVDNGSTDNTSQILSDWSKKDFRFRAISEHRVGLSVAKNSGVRDAKGQIILFTDDDVIVESSWIGSYWDFFGRRDGQLVIVGGPVIPIPHDLNGWPSWFGPRVLPDVGLLDYQSERPLGESEWVWGANMGIPSRLFARFGLWDESVGRKADERGTFEDVEYQERVKKGGGEVWFCPAARLKHRVERAGITPRRVISNLFSRGLSDSGRYHGQTNGRAIGAPKQRFFKSTLFLIGYRLAWTALTAIFSLWRTKLIFETSRAVAWSSAWWLKALYIGRSGRLSFRIIEKFAFITRRQLIRLTPDFSEAPSEEGQNVFPLLQGMKNR